MTDPKSDAELRRIYREIAGANPTVNIPVLDEEQQRVFIAKTLHALMERTHPMVLMTMLVIALGYMADTHNINREHLTKLLGEARQTMPLVMEAKP